MEQALLSIFTTSFLIFSLVVALLVMVVRGVVEAIFHKVEVILPSKIEDVLKDLWREWILRILPVIAGGLLAYFVVKYPFPAEFGASASGRIFFGIVAGLFSSTVYSFTKFHMNKYVPETIKTKIDKINPLSMKPKQNGVVQQNVPENTVEAPVPDITQNETQDGTQN